ncbi:inner centromere protein isoform X2 [Myripristis murdjan]|uniref:inner centromere protein isoform X2 n=1 Tax=Myripristis murdjan TaxID=586833 RepID=UPI0011760147|nr:inner centromere protein isoform X2 [Myripristis murdjan]
MNSVFSSVRSLMQMFDGKIQEFISDVDNVHMVWLEEIQQEANRMFSSDSTEPELMPKTPSQKKNSRRKRVSLGRQEENQTKRRFSKGKRSNLRGSAVNALNLISEEASEASTSEATTTKSTRSTRRNKQTQPEVAVDPGQSSFDGCKSDKGLVPDKEPAVVEEGDADKQSQENISVTEKETDKSSDTVPSPPKLPLPEVAVSISEADRLSAEMAKKPEASPGRTATKIAIAGAHKGSRRSSVRHSLKLRHSLAGLRHSMTQESVRRASRRSILKKKTRLGNSTCNSNVSEDSSMETEVEEDAKEVLAVSDEEVNAGGAEQSEDIPKKLTAQNTERLSGRITRSMAVNSPTVARSALLTSSHFAGTPNKSSVGSQKKPDSQSSLWSRQSGKRKAPDTTEESPTKRPSPPKKSQSAIKPHMKSFHHTVQKNQMLMMTPTSLGRTAVIKSFIKYTTPVKADPKMKERLKLEALKKKQEQEEERMKKMEEEKRKKQEEIKRKRDERLRKVVEARVKEEQKEEEKKKKIEQKMAQIDEKNDKLRVERLAEEKAKKKVAMKRQEELEQRRKLEEEARKKKIQQAEEEKRQQELLAKRKAEEEEQQRARKLVEARRALELKREQELERERQAAAERERAEKEKALALQRELERAAREKERRELEERRKLEERKKQEEQQRLAAEERAAREREVAKQREAAAKNALTTNIQTHAGKGAEMNVTMDIERTVMKTPAGKGGGLNVTMDIEQSPQSYSITPKGGNKPVVVSQNPEDYGMDQNSDDSTDDESAPRKPIPSWAEGQNLQKAIIKQYFSPFDLHSYCGGIEPPRLENIFYKSKPRYFKRTSSAVWHSPPRIGNHL